MWQPEPGWQRLSGGGPSTVGLWRGHVRGRDVVIKRLQAPAANDPGDLSIPSNPAWWRRAADVALDGCVEVTSGLRAAPTVTVEEDLEGVTLVTEEVVNAHNSGLFMAKSLGEFANVNLPQRPWLARQVLRKRLEHVAHRGGWRVLARTSIADAAEHLWQRRESYLAQFDALPQVPSHQDPVPGNLLGRDAAGHLVAIDWATLGLAPAGADLGYLALNTREEFEPLWEAYCSRLAVATPAQAMLGARIVAVYTVLTRADWALSRVASGEGALAGKFRHPAVAPHLLALQRQLGHLEALIG